MSSFLLDRSISALLDGEALLIFSSYLCCSSILVLSYFELIIAIFLAALSTLFIFMAIIQLSILPFIPDLFPLLHLVNSRFQFSDFILTNLDGISLLGNCILPKLNSLKTQHLQISISKTPLYFTISFEALTSRLLLT